LPDLGHAVDTLIKYTHNTQGSKLTCEKK
jgi:hypothetical protein